MGKQSVRRGNGAVKFKLSYVLIVLVSLAIVTGGYFGYREYTQLRDENRRLSNPEEAAKTDIEKTKAQVAALIEVPTGEEPTIANVVDVSKLSNQEFFKNAKNGDRLLVYQNAKKAILYRPETNKIIEVSTINIGDGENKKSADSKAKTETAPTSENTSSQSNLDTGLPGLQ